MFKCEEIEAGDELVCIEDYETCFTKGDVYVVVNMNLASEAPINMACDCECGAVPWRHEDIGAFFEAVKKGGPW